MPDEPVDEPMPEEEEEPTVAELAARLNDLEERETAFDEEIAERVKRLEGDEEEPEEEDSEGGEESGDMPDDEEERALSKAHEKIRGFLAVLEEQK